MRPEETECAGTALAIRGQLAAQVRWASEGTAEAFRCAAQIWWEAELKERS